MGSEGAAAGAVTERLGALGAAMRAGGARVGVDELLVAHRALAAVDASARGEAERALRAALCSRREDLAVFAAAFAACFGADPAAPSPTVPDEDMRLALPRAPGGGRAGEEEAERDSPFDPDPLPAAWSAVELLKTRDFASYTDAERARARTLIARLGRRGPMRRSRRTRATHRRRGGGGERPDPRATLRAALRHGGEPLERRWREPTWRARPLVLVCDVSGSMEPYARALLQYCHACVAARRRVEAFAFGTRLTRVTRELARRDPDAALARAADTVADWHGGTRIGAAIATLNRVHGRRLGRGAVVVVLSDGWDRGDPEQLGAEMARLRRSSHRLIWLNPLKAQPGYEPLTRGMQAALPHVDRFLAGESIASLEELAGILEEDPP